MRTRPYMRLKYASIVSLVVALTIFGYPIIALVTDLLNLQSQIFSMLVRFFVLVLSMVLLLERNTLRNLRQMDRMLLLFFAVYLMRLLWDWQVQSIVAADLAIIFFLFTVVLPTMAAATRAHLINERTLRQTMLIFGLVFVGLIFIMLLYGRTYNPWADQHYSPGRLFFEALNPITIGQAAGVLVIAGMLGILENGARFRWRVLSAFGVVLGLVSAILANSRGPILSLVVALLYISWSRPRLAVFVGVVGGSYSFFQGMQGDLIQNTFERFYEAVQLTDKATEARIVLMKSGWEDFLGSPIFGAHYIDPDFGVGSYPHNLFIEAGMALGILGLGIFVALNVRFLAVYVSRIRFPFGLIHALGLFFFIGILFSGALWGASGYFMFLALCLALAKKRKRSQVIARSAV
jgi:O-antigen ligase